MRFWDANACYGQVKSPMPNVDYSLQGLLRRMDEYQIDHALTYHAMARELDAVRGNRQLMEDISGNDRLIPVWALLPHHTGEMAAPDELTEEMTKKGVKAAIMFPSTAEHNFSMKKWSIGPLMDALAAHRLPLLIGAEQLGGMEGVGELAMAYPDLTVIALNIGYRADRILYPLMETTRNLYIETSTFKSFWGLKAFAERFGADRLIFGSGMPAIDPAASAAVVTWSGLTQAQQEAVAHGNIERLIGEVR